MSKPHVSVPRSATQATPIKELDALRWQDHGLMVLTIFCLTVVLLLMMVPMLSMIYFDVDPRSESEAYPLTVLGPISSVWLAVISMGLSSLVMIFHHLSGKRIAWLSSLLVMAGMGACWYHMGDGVESMHRSTLWAGAMAMALAARHLAEHDRLRRLIVASLVAMLIPMALQSLVFVLVEHPQTVEMFNENQEKFLQARGWLQGSAQHLLYVRRLMFNDATGAFGLSNIYGSILAALVVMGLVICGHVARQWRATWAIVPLAAVVFGLATIYLSHSKGALAVLAAGAILMFVALMLCKMVDRSRLTLPLLAMLLIIGASVAVVARGAIGGVPPTAEGERSILFRYQYWQGATRVVSHMDRKALLVGLGPGQFKQAYVIHKDPLNPEEVTSTHNVFLDYWLSLGLGGVCWSLVLLGWVFKGGELAGEELTSMPNPRTLLAPEGVRDKTIVLVCALALLVFGFRFGIQGITLLAPEALLSYTGGAIGFIVLTSVLMSDGWLTKSATRTGLFLAGSVLLIHNQIEMTFFHDGSCVVALFIVGAAGGGQLQPQRKDKKVVDKPAMFRLVFPIAMLALLVMTVKTSALPMTRYQGQLSQAEIQLRDYKSYLEAIGHLEQANNIIPASPRAWRWRIQLLAELTQGTLQAGQRSRALVMFQHTEEINRQALKQCPKDLMLLRQIAHLQMLAAQWFNQPARQSLALANWNVILQRNPYGLSDHLAYADLLWDMGRRKDAAKAYEKTIMVSDQAYLDPDKQLAEKDRKRCLERIGKSRTGS